MNHYMRKHQNLEPIPDHVIERTTMPFVEKNHGTTGPARTSFNHSFLPIEHDFINACDEVTGLAKKPIDPWSGDHIGKCIVVESLDHPLTPMFWQAFITP